MRGHKGDQSSGLSHEGSMEILRLALKAHERIDKLEKELKLLREQVAVIWRV